MCISGLGGFSLLASANNRKEDEIMENGTAYNTALS